MPITSNQPWSVKSNIDGTAGVLDSSRKAIGFFFDWQDAELVVKQVNEGARIETLQADKDELIEETERLDKAIDKLEAQNDDLKDEVSELKDQVTTLEANLESANEEIESLKENQ